MSVQPEERAMVSERIAPGMLPRVLNSFDMTIIFVAIVLFIVNASALQPAGQSAFTFWILGFLVFLIPGALVTSQLGQMFPQEGSLYVWTQKALGPFWGFFAGFCAWWPGILVMVATGDAVVTIWQFIDSSALTKAWEQGLVILAVLWFSAGMSMHAPALHPVLRERRGGVLRRGGVRDRPGRDPVPDRERASRHERLGPRLQLRIPVERQPDPVRAGDPGPSGSRGAAEHGRRDRPHALDPQVPVLGLDRGDGGLPVGHAGHDALARRVKEPGGDDRHPARGPGRLLELSRVRGGDRPAS